jgi:uncharacterized BrkB/YihY/UPF0761 family membrane protein
MILLTWLWLSSMALLFAAMINTVLAELRSEHRGAVPELRRPFADSRPF